MKFPIPRFVWSWPSWVTELVSGLLTVAIAVGLMALPVTVWTVAGLATVLSVFYERTLDANGWSWDDVGQREVGILLGALVIGLIH